MSETLPIPFRWDGETFRPVGSRAQKECDAAFTIGEVHTLVEVQQRSLASHKAYFASLHEAWKNLDDDQMQRWPDSEHLRHYALIKCGYATQRQIIASSKAEAQRLAAFIRPVNTYALIEVRDCVVTEWTAESQSFRSMGKQRFEESKRAVLDYVASLIGVTTGDLQQNTGRAA